MRPGEGCQAGSRGPGPRRRRAEPGGALLQWRLSWGAGAHCSVSWPLSGHLRVTLGSEKVGSSPRTCPELQGDFPGASCRTEHCSRDPEQTRGFRRVGPPETGAEGLSKPPPPKPGDPRVHCGLARALPLVAGLGEGMLRLILLPALGLFSWMALKMSNPKTRNQLRQLLALLGCFPEGAHLLLW